MVLLSIKPRLQKKSGLYIGSVRGDANVYLDSSIWTWTCENDGEELKNDRREGWFAAGRGLFSVEGFQEPWELMCAQLVFVLSFFSVGFLRRSFVGYFVRFFLE